MHKKTDIVYTAYVIIHEALMSLRDFFQKQIKSHRPQQCEWKWTIFRL